jgi:TPR repeat protein
MFWLAHAYQSDGHFGIYPPDQAEARRLYQRAAEAGHTTALVRLSLQQDRGLGGFKPDPAAASRLMMKALEARDEEARVQMTTFGASWFSEAFRREMQQRLKEAGVYDGPIDGKWDAPSLRAIAALRARGGR